MLIALTTLCIADLWSGQRHRVGQPQRRDYGGYEEGSGCVEEHPYQPVRTCRICTSDPLSKVDKVDATMDQIREQMDLTNEISDAISNPVGMGAMVDEDELEAELEALEQEELDSRLQGADHVPVHTPASPVGVANGREHAPAVADEDDEEAQLRQLQAELAQ